MSNFTIKTYESLDEIDKEHFFNFCKEASLEEKDPASANMWSDDNTISRNTILYKLEKKSQFKEPNGKFFVLFFDKEIVGCSGVYKSAFSEDIYIAGSRTWIKKQFRNNSLNKKYFFPIQRKWVLEKKGKIIALTFNNYNKNIIEIFKRNRLGETNGRISSRSSTDLFFNNFNEVKFSLNINNTEQWVCYETLDNNFNFDWETIKY